MRKTIAVRIDESLEKALEERARASGTTVSEVVRETLRDALAERPLAERIGHLKRIPPHARRRRSVATRAA